jgi:hypothetical protein
MGIYRYIATKIGLGVGAQNQAFQRPYTLPLVGFSPGNHLVRKPLNPIASGAVLMGQTVVPVSLLGDTGAAMQGGIKTLPLAQPVKG